MRTTLTIDDDAYEALERAARRANVSFKEMANLVIRRGLEVSKRNSGAPAFELRPRNWGLTREGIKLENTSELMDSIDGERHR